jgi:putative spermidine/putrescine transport system permease protein
MRQGDKTDGRGGGVGRRGGGSGAGGGDRRRGGGSVGGRVWLLAGAVVILLPLLLLVVWVFVGRWPWPELIPQTFSLRAPEELFDPQSKALSVLGSSVGLSVLVALVALAVSLPAARVLALARFRGKGLVQFAVLLPVIVPATAFAMGVHSLFIPLRLNDTLTGVIIVHTIVCLPYTVSILTQVAQATGDRLEAQARTLGASPLQALLHITIPTAMPGIISSACMAFIVSFSQYFVTLLIGGGRVMTYALFLFPYVHSGDRSMAAGYGLVFVLASLLVFVIFDRLTRRFYKLDAVTFYG